MRSRLAFVAMLILSAAPAVAQHEHAAQPFRAAEKYEGRRLAEALRALQARGLRIVFSSEIVTPDMRVVAEPRAKVARQLLDELLEPHGLKAEEGPGGVIQVIRAKPAKAIDSRKQPKDTTTRAIRGQMVDAATQGTGTYSERVIVTAPRLERRDPGVGSEVSLGSDELQNLRGVLADDPMRAVQTLPRVATGDDFRSEFSVRGSPYRHVGVVVDGVATRWLQHAAYGRGDSGSLAMLSSDALEQATLQAGAYPHRYGDRLGAQLGLTLRQGSRAATQLRGAIGRTSATLVVEGPIGTSERGSWLFTLRQSYLDWPIRQLREPGGTVFGFADAQAKLVYDVRPSQQVSFSVLGGRSSIDERDDRGPNELGDGTNRAAVVNLGWRSMFGSRLVLSQRAYLVAHQFLNESQDGHDWGRGADGELSYRADVGRTMFGGLLEAGGQVQRMHGSRHVPRYGEPVTDSGLPLLQSVGGFDGSSWLRSGYAHFTWTATPRLTFAPGLRVADSTLVDRRTVARWILGEWSFRSGWTLNASAGVSHQFPEFEHMLGGVSTPTRRSALGTPAGAPGLRPERARHVDIGIERRLAKSVRWQATFFNREEREILREPDTHPRLVGGVVTEPPSPGRYENALSGSSRGAELLLERQSPTGLSGWVAYSFGKTRYTDAARDETFWGDFDQRHAINVSGVYRLSDRTSVAVKLRGGTNFPIPGYLVARDGGLFVGGRRNDVRLPNYARLDVRANRTFNYARRRLTLFVEVLNVLNRTNLGLADGFIRRRTGEAVGFTEELFPRLPSAGILIEF